jgi:predicted nucleotidyltransferase
MRIERLIYHSQARFKFWTWYELKNLTGKDQREIEIEIDEFNSKQKVADPFALLTYNHKNYNSKYIDSLQKNYTNPESFNISYNKFGAGNNITKADCSPYWFHLVNNNDWYWKQKWLAKYKMLFLLIPGVKNIFLACSVASQISTPESDIDLLIQVDSNCVWITKIYFAVLSKLLKYYNFNFFLGFWFWFTNQQTLLNEMKRINLQNKMKIDFGMVFENWLEVGRNYSDIARHYSIWNNINIKKNLNYFEPPLFKFFCFLIFPLYYLIFPFFIVIGITHFVWQSSHNKNNPNMVITWTMYSQYNKIY